MRLFKDAIRPNMLIMDNNPTLNWTANIAQLLENEYIKRMDWTAIFQNLNPVGIVQDLQVTCSEPAIIPQLKLVLQEK